MIKKGPAHLVSSGQIVERSHRSLILLLLSAVPGVFVMSRALPPHWREVGLARHGSGTVQVLMLAGGLVTLFLGLFLCRTFISPNPCNAGRLASRSKRIAFATITCFLIVLLTAGLTEILLRAMGQGPYCPPRSTASTAAGSGLFVGDSVLGYTHLPGRHRFELKDGHSFVATHLPNTLRVTRPLDSPKNNLDLPEVWIFGCSLTHGWSVADDQTYPWLLDQMRDDLKVVNFGVTGYGTVQSLLQLREALRTGGHPAVVVLAYAGLHDERNTFQRSWRKVAGVFPRPYVRFAQSGSLKFDFGRPDYREWAGMKTFALVHAVERYFIQRETTSLRSHEVSKRVIRQFAEACEKRGIVWVLAGMDQEPLTKETVLFAMRNGWNGLDMSVDLQQPENNNKPIDAHPSAIAHAKYARSLNECLFTNDFIKRATRVERQHRKPNARLHRAERTSSTVTFRNPSNP
ncbi:MAG: SGNH/GDSL hydrolase family protein [Planctomycetes bacterium]|nr:SGNH/GDSL hydrolase family protein [Planctomycetota bacterium]